MLFGEQPSLAITAANKPDRIDKYAEDWRSEYQRYSEWLEDGEGERRRPNEAEELEINPSK